jgi:O-acetyl-ADP-ribose deacetylase (regulator of RNase III)
MEPTIVDGDLFSATQKYICHQCNCVTNKAAHLAFDMFERFPYADVYSKRVTHSQPGTIEVRGNGQDQRFVVALFGQFYPGSPKYPTSDRDGFVARRNYFQLCLTRLAQIKDLQSVAFPWGIGCGAAGGDWAEYLQMINTFSQLTSAEVIVYKKRGV